MKFVILTLNLWLEHQVDSSFSWRKLQKVEGKGKLHHIWSFNEYSDDRKMYVVAWIDKYLGRSASWYVQGQNELLRHMTPYKKVIDLGNIL